MSIRKNLAYNIMYQILTIIIPLITTPYISKTIGPEGVGLQSYTYSIVNYFVLLAMLGINNHGNRSIAMAKDDKEKLSKTFISIYSLQIITSLIMITIYGFFITIVDEGYKILFIIQFIYLISALLDINWFFFGMEDFKLTVTRNSIIKIISTISIFIFIKDSDDIYIYSLILALGTLISQLVLWKFISKYIRFKGIDIKVKDIKEHVKPILILFIPVIAISIYKVMDKIMLGSMSTITQVGFYENSEKIIGIPVMIISALGTVMLPKLSNLESRGNVEQSKKYISASMDFVMFISFGAIFGLIGISPILIPIFLGTQFIQCIDIVSLLSITILFLSWANVIRTQFLIPKKKDNIYIESTILGAIINLISNLILISKYGAIGATIGTILAEATVAIYQTFKVKSELEVGIYLKRNIFYIIPGIIMCIIIKYIGSVLPISILTGFVQIIVGGTVYTLISVIYILVINSYGKIRNSLIE